MFDFNILAIWFFTSLFYCFVVCFLVETCNFYDVFYTNVPSQNGLNDFGTSYGVVNSNYFSILYNQDGYYECAPSGSDAIKTISLLDGLTNIKLIAELCVVGECDRFGLGIYDSANSKAYAYSLSSNDNCSNLITTSPLQHSRLTSISNISDMWLIHELSVVDDILEYTVKNMDGEIIVTESSTVANNVNPAWGITIGHFNGKKGYIKNVKVVEL